MKKNQLWLILGAAIVGYLIWQKMKKPALMSTPPPVPLPPQAYPNEDVLIA